MIIILFLFPCFVKWIHWINTVHLLTRTRLPHTWLCSNQCKYRFTISRSPNRRHSFRSTRLSSSSEHTQIEWTHTQMFTRNSSCKIGLTRPDLLKLREICHLNLSLLIFKVLWHPRKWTLFDLVHTRLRAHTFEVEMQVGEFLRNREELILHIVNTIKVLSSLLDKRSYSGCVR